MAITAAQAIRMAVPNIRPMIADEKVANVSGVQAGAAAIAAAFTRVTLSTGGTGGSLVLPNLINEDAGGCDMYIVANETAGNILVYPDVGDTLNNSANAALTIAANGFGIFVRERRAPFPYVAPDWAAAAFI